METQKKVIMLACMTLIFPIAALLGFEYKNSNEAPIPEGSPTEGLLAFLKAGAEKDAAAVSSLTDGTRRRVLENKPNAMEEFFEEVKDLDFNSPIRWAEEFKEDYALVDVEISILGSEKKFQTRHRLKKIDGIWKVVI